MVKKSELKLDIKFYDISRWGNYSRGGQYRLGKGFDQRPYSGGYIKYLRDGIFETGKSQNPTVFGQRGPSSIQCSNPRWA